jgi:hypothetical protein
MRTSLHYEMVLFKFWAFLTSKNFMFAALFEINHNILIDIIAVFLQKKASTQHFIKYFRILKFTYTCNKKKNYFVLKYFDF